MSGIVGNEPFGRSGVLGKFASKGIEDNSSGTTGLTFATDGIPTFNESEFYNNGIHSWEFSFTGTNTTAVDFDFTVPDIGYFYFIARFGSEQAVGYYNARTSQGQHNGTTIGDQAGISYAAGGGGTAIGAFSWSKSSSTNFRFSKAAGTYTNVIHGFIKFSTTIT